MSVFGFDFGNHSSYVSIVRSGGIDSVDNEYSYRATPTCISFTDHTRLIGSSALPKAIMNHKNTFSHFKNLIGLFYDDPIAQMEMPRIPANFIKMDDGTIGVQAHYMGKAARFSIVQLVGMMLSGLVNTALRHSPSIMSCVISAPVFFTDLQRRALCDACSIAGLTPSSIMSDCAAICTSYVLFKTDLPTNDSDWRFVAFVDVGYSSTQVCIAAFKKDKFKIHIAQGTLDIGGRVFDSLLFERFSADFLAQHKLDVRTNHKATLKLMSQCESVKKQINTTISVLPIRIECFMNDIDFSSKICRAEFDEMSAPLYQCLEDFLQRTLLESKISSDKIYAVELVGGTSRIIGVKSIIEKVFNKASSTTLNADEAVSRGCAIKAALFSPSVKARAIDGKDIISSNIFVQFTGKNGSLKQLEIFKKGDFIPATKKITFPPNEDFHFDVFENSSLGQNYHIAKVSASGASPQECHAQNLFFSANLDTFSLFSVDKAGYESFESKPNDDENNEESEKKSPQKAPPTIHPLTVCQTLSYLNGSNLQHFITVEKEIQKNNALEVQRVHARNTLEEFVYSLREKIDPTYLPFMTQAEVDELSQLLSNEEEWIYNEGESETEQVYNDRLSSLQDKFQPIYSRSQGFSRSFDSLQKLSNTLAKYRKFLDLYSSNPLKYDFITPEEYQSYSQKVVESDEFAICASHTLNNQEKTRLPSVPYLDIDEKTNTLRAVCEPILKKSENPPPPPAPPKTENLPETQNSFQPTTEPEPVSTESQ